MQSNEDKLSSVVFNIHFVCLFNSDRVVFMVRTCHTSSVRRWLAVSINSQEIIRNRKWLCRKLLCYCGRTSLVLGKFRLFVQRITIIIYAKTIDWRRNTEMQAHENENQSLFKPKTSFFDFRQTIKRSFLRFEIDFIKLKFSKFRNPNVSPEVEHESRPERSRLKNIDWASYESVHKRYLLLGKSIIYI